MTESIDPLRHDTKVDVLVEKCGLNDGNAPRCLGCPILDRRHNVGGLLGYASTTIVSADYTSADAAEDEAALRRVNCESHTGCMVIPVTLLQLYIH